MKLNETIQLQEAKFSSPVIMYHGTTSKNIRSILSQGLHGQRSGTGFGSSQTGGAIGRDMTAIGGVYLTSSIRVAQSAASSVTNNNENSVIVVVSVQPQSGLADEDDIDLMIKNAMGSHQPRTALNAYLDSVANRDNPNDLLRRFPEQIQNLLKKQPNTTDLVTKMKQSYLARSLSYDLRKGSPWNMPPKYIMADKMNIRDQDEIDSEFNELLDKVGTPQEAERRYRIILERLTVALKRFSYDTGVNDRAFNTGPLGSSLRMSDGIGYRGNNKIIGVIEVDDDNDEYVVHYDRGGVKHLQHNETMDIIFGVSDNWVRAR